MAKLGVRLLLITVASLRGTAQSVSEDDIAARSAHWVIRTSDLRKTTDFFKDVFAMRVLRHEENDKPCPITCNGDYPTAWSKTMIGYETEDKAYSLEITYNYGIEKYPMGTGLASMTIAVDDAEAASKRAEAKGYPARPSRDGKGFLILGPDSYRFLITERPANRQEPFQSVELRAEDVARTRQFYTSVLGMQEMPKTGTSAGDDDIVLAYGGDQVSLVFISSPNAPPRIEQYEGRHAISLPAESLKKIYGYISKARPDLVVHEIMELDEALGTLFIAIIKDPDGFEICLVSSETFDKAVLSAADFKEPDWIKHDEILKETLKKIGGPIKAKGAGAHDSYVPPPENSSMLERVSAVASHVAATAQAPSTMSDEEKRFFIGGFTIGFVLLRGFLYFVTS